MTRLHVPRRLLSILAALSLVAGLSAPAGVIAATPAGWSVDAVELPSAVTPGAVAGYRVTISNAGPSTLSQLFLTTATATNPATVFVSGPGCDAAGTELFCRLPAVKKGKSVSVVVAYTTPTTGATFDITFEVNTTGATDSDGGTSHGDTISAFARTTLRGSDADDLDFYGAFALEQVPVGNNQGLSGTNPQTTLVSLPAGSIAVTVEDGPGVSGNCPAAFTCFGQISEIHVNEGTIYPGGFSVLLQWDSSLNPPNQINNIDIWHEFDTPKPGPNGTLILGEDITNSCQFVGQSTTPKTIPCIQRLGPLPGGDRAAIVWLTENGKTFGH